MALNLSKTVVDILKDNAGKYFTAKELAAEVLLKKPTECQNKMKRTNITTKEDLIEQLAREISARTFRSVMAASVKTTADRPRKYYYSEKTDTQEIEEAEKATKTNNQPEHDLYPLVCQYLKDELNIYPKRIDERKSSNSKGPRGNIWLHPDIVGIKNLSDGWDTDVVNCVNKHAYNKTSLWSFEVKIKINLSNVREYFFQTVSNSSWANNSYLIAEEIDDRAMEELRILCSGHNIGVILLNKKEPNESQILIPAVEKEKLDWNMINRIAKENPDFKSFVSLITEFYQTGKIKDRDWDISK